MKVLKGFTCYEKGKKAGTLYLCTISSHGSIYATFEKVDVVLWHHHLSHTSSKEMQILHLKNLLLGLKKVNQELCKDSVSKNHKKVRLVEVKKEKKSVNLELIYQDEWVIASASFLGGLPYHITFIDDAASNIGLFK